MVNHLLEVMDCALHLLGSGVPAPIRQKAVKTASALLLLPTPNPVQTQARYVLATLYGTRATYHSYKDGVLLQFVYGELQAMQPKLEKLESLQKIDPEAFYRLILLVRGIANARPQSLAKICAENNYDIVPTLMGFVLELHKVTPELDEPINIVKRGLCQAETIVHCLVEIMYGFALADPGQVGRMTKYFIDLLKHDASVISHSAKEALILLLSPRVKRRKVAIVTPPACSTPTPSTSTMQTLQAVAASTASDIIEEAAAVAVDAAVGGGGLPDPNPEAEGGVVEVGAVGQQQILNLEAFMGGGFPRLLGLPEDADDEAIMDIAIALSLQQHGGDANALQSLQQGLANLQGIRQAAAMAAASNAAASVSAGGSDDDEGSNVATDGSTLRTSPAEPAGSGGSESGGSGVESIGGTSARSSNFGDHANASPPRQGSAKDDQEQPGPSGAGGSGGVAGFSAMSSSEDNEINEDDKLSKLHDLR